jgi:hypothetical protein
MTTCCSDFKGSLDVFLPLDLLEVGLGDDRQLIGCYRHLGRNGMQAG